MVWCRRFSLIDDKNALRLTKYANAADEFAARVTQTETANGMSPSRAIRGFVPSNKVIVTWWNCAICNFRLTGRCSMPRISGAFDSVYFAIPLFIQWRKCRNYVQ
jgi:hypothetical protein